MDTANRDDFAHFYPLTVSWGDMDALGHVNNTVFYRYSEDGRMDYLQRALEVIPGAGHGGAPILADLRCRFLQQLRFPAQVEIATRTARIGNTSFHMQQALFQRGGREPVAAFDAMLVWFDYSNQSSAPVPEVVRAHMRQMEVVAPQE